MASKINKKMNVTIDGILDITDGIIKLEVQDIDEPVSLVDYIQDFADKNVKITVAYSKEL